ncbi:MAG: phospho-N-acetylmuramoyl-pentapeptide-transferase [Planctomycetes bacterium]|nr:phospho-N-acetylmuramoyl-pentapeptide-transferase [Planctomycetota bacterium]
MIHWLAPYVFSEDVCRLLGYISVRAGGAAVTAFLLAVLFGPRVIGWLRRQGMGERVDGTGSEKLEELHKDKAGTPTMGGLFVIGSILAAGLLWLRFDGVNQFSLPGLMLIAAFSAIGFWDDWTKLKQGQSGEQKRGISKRQKQGALTVVAVLICLWLTGPAGLQADVGGPRLYVPFAKDWSLDLSVMWGVPFLAFAVIVLTGSANAVNLTDGLDGLAAGCIATSAIAYAAITYAVGRVDWAQYLLVPHVGGAGEMAVLMAALLGGALGFLWFNAAPALVFMGDVGSLGLGGALAYAALISRTELVLLVVGGVFVAEALSVILQVGSFKLSGKRIFRCAPLHHHFQFGGMPETRVVARTWIVSALLAMCSLLLFKVR